MHLVTRGASVFFNIRRYFSRGGKVYGYGKFLLNDLLGVLRDYYLDLHLGEVFSAVWLHELVDDVEANSAF